MATTTLLAGDMGGTKTLLALYGSEAGQLRLLHQERFRSGEWPSLEPMLEAFLNNRPADLPAPAHACIACLLYTSPSPRDVEESRMPSSA